MKRKFDILVIDDEQVILGSIVKLCSADGLKVDTVMNANEGLKKLRKNEYSLIICDIMMPEMDGFQFLDYIYENQVTIPTIITTGFSTVENAVKSLSKGAIDFLPKPFTVDELLSVVHRGLNYGIILNKQNLQDTDAKDSTPQLYVSCPTNYLKLGYSSWAVVEDTGSAKIGITDHFLKTISTIERIDFFNLDEEIVQGNNCAFARTDDQMIHQIMAPMTGRIIKINEKLQSNTNIIAKDPYFEGWLYIIIPSELEYEMKCLTNGAVGSE
jgi:FixJ family two-component response regulator/glycine cleavage system H lipoate-binding protein